eukprot:TRINITY_DN2464_c0_g4_i1.p2 TRINITY_DN2464_c0_g4~~TRINITY_DN2464_c0_g4_i1.p2  ORF type:complete len:113 (+),score=3.02 TRINITY_DN2464_c0_g4_i1:216-554(+)
MSFPFHSLLVDAVARHTEHFHAGSFCQRAARWQLPPLETAAALRGTVLCPFGKAMDCTRCLSEIHLKLHVDVGGCFFFEKKHRGLLKMFALLTPHRPPFVLVIDPVCWNHGV